MRQIKILLKSKSLRQPVTSKIIDKSIEILNTIFNSTLFRDKIIDNKFVCTNKPELCGADNFISGQAVYDDLMSVETISLRLEVKKLRNPWKRWVSKTKGETRLTGNTIKSYTWWLKNRDEKELTIIYASHVGHEIFHTNYYQYKHDPEIGSKTFQNDKDVTYKIDDIIEELIRTHLIIDNN